MNAVYQKVTEKIIEQMEKGVIPWRKTWKGQRPVNWMSQKPYRGLNRLLLDGGEYITFKQCAENKGKVKKGAKSNLVIFWKWYEKETEEDGEKKTEHLPVLRYYNVFHISDCLGIESKIYEAQDQIVRHDVDDIISEYIKRSNIKLRNVIGSNSAYYSPYDDSVTLPDKIQFDSEASYYSVVFHELIHSTGHKSRLDRIRSTSFGSDAYSAEELVAEIGSSMLMSESGIELDETFQNSVSYINSWLKVLKSDNRMIITAAAQAEKAVDLILGRDESTIISEYEHN